MFVRSRNTKAGQSASGKAFKFQRVHNLQRVAKVCANTTGAFGVLRVDYNSKPIDICGNTIAQDLAKVQPYLTIYQGERHRPQSPQRHPFTAPDEELEDCSVDGDIQKLSQFLDILVWEKSARLDTKSSAATAYGERLPHGADIIVCTASAASFPAHRVILGARVWHLRAVLEDSKVIQDKEAKISIRLFDARQTPTSRGFDRIEFNGCHPLSVLIFLHFIYSDDLLAIWDRRVFFTLEQRLHSLRIKPPDIKSELLALARILDLHFLVQALEPPVKRIPAPSMACAVTDLFNAVQRPISKRSILAHDVVLQLADKDVLCHSVILRARSAFFADFFDGDDWTAKRWDAHGVVTIDMKHLKWHVMEYVLWFMCCGGDKEIFDTLGMNVCPGNISVTKMPCPVDFINSIDEVLDFMFDVMAAAVGIHLHYPRNASLSIKQTELLLDRLVHLCSAIILKHTNIYNALYILADATHFHAEQLAERLQSYLTVNMELFLDGGMLDDIPIALVEQLSRFAQRQQVEKSSISRSNILAQKALESHAEWLALQDIPSVILRSTHLPTRKSFTNVKSSPPGPNRRTPRPPTSPPQSPSIRPEKGIRRPPSDDDIFVMDDTDAFPLLTLDQSPTTQNSKTSNAATGSSFIWKAPSMPRCAHSAILGHISIILTK